MRQGTCILFLLLLLGSIAVSDASAQVQIRPRFVVILDSSGSMMQSPQQIVLGPTFDATLQSIPCSIAPPTCTRGNACSYPGGACPGGQRCGPNGICSACGRGLDCDTGSHCTCPGEFGESLCQVADSLCHTVDGVATHGDGSQEQLGCDVNGDGLFNDSKMFQAKGALSNVISGYGEAEYSLERYNQLTGGNSCSNSTGQATCNVFCGRFGDPLCVAGTSCVQVIPGVNCASGGCACLCNSGSCGNDYHCNNCPTGPDGTNFFACVNLGAGNRCEACPVNFASFPFAVDLTNGLQDICQPTSYIECPSSFACSQCDLNSGERAICNQFQVDAPCKGDARPLPGGPGATVTCASGAMTDPNMCIKYSGVYGNGAGGCVNGTGDILVNFPSPVYDNYNDLISWINNTETDGQELRATGATPLEGALASARTFLSQQVLGADTAAACRAYNVILITDGMETCGGTPASAAGSLRMTPIGATGMNKDVKTYVIGFSLCPPSDPNCAAGQSLNAIAAAGGTGSAFLVNDEVSLEATLANIIQNSIPREICNGDDDNCNGQCDETFPQVGVNPTSPTGKTCSNAHPAQTCTVGVGLCQRTGVFKCSGPQSAACCVNDGQASCTPLAAGTPGTERCPPNGIDDDCNGVVDDIPGGCPTATPEVCNGNDDDRDTLTDEWGDLYPCPMSVPPFGTNCRCFSGGVESACPAAGPLPATCGCLPACGSSVGECRPGQLKCLSATQSCVGSVGPSAEICDCRDNNCNGIVDDVPSVACYPSGTAGCTPNGAGGFTCVGICRAGATSCQCSMGTATTVCGGAVTPTSEVMCNGLDDNCNGQVDEPQGQPCYPAGTVGCVANGSGGFSCTGACRAGTYQCQGGSLTCVGSVTPQPEQCNGVDDDCDGVPDSAPGEVNCGSGVGVCTPDCELMGSTWACNPLHGRTTETCNGLDDDCNGVIDDNLGAPFGQACAPTGATCNLSAGTCCGICTPGLLRCIAGASVCDGATPPRAETCNGVDDNCDCQVDNGIPGFGGPCGSSVGACRPGTFQCQMGMPQCVGGTGPTSETCNGIDDDCDGVVDNNIMGVGNACYDAGPPGNCNLSASPPSCNGICRPGQLVCDSQMMRLVCQGQSGPQPERCNGQDDDCNGVVDDGFNVGGACTMMYGTCPSMGRYVCLPDGSGTTCNAPPVSSSNEICDGLDNNCNGRVDEPEGIWPCPTAAPNPQGCICPTGRSCGNTADLPFCYCPPQCGLGVGECQPGHLECQNAMQRCVGGTSPTPEVCDCLDNNCNGIVDDNPMGEGDPCFTFTGPNGMPLSTSPPSTCRPGHKHCQTVATVCTFACLGQIGPSPEICDGLDNDCDGIVDNGAMCPPMYACINGTCQPNCRLSEFPCTADRRCVDPQSGNECAPTRTDCVCLPNLCLNAPCDPATQDCIILNNMASCRDRCPPGKCTPPEMCVPATGMCVDCHSTGCRQGEVCIGSPGECQPDPCFNRVCNPGQFCQNGACVNLCQNVTCPDRQICVAGGCIPDRCAGVRCMPGYLCNPGTGMCRPDMCGLGCPLGERCVPSTGQCVPDTCLTTHCPSCTECSFTFDGTTDCVTQPLCERPPSVTALGGGGCACDIGGSGGASGSGLLVLLLAALATLRARRRP